MAYFTRPKENDLYFLLLYLLSSLISLCHSFMLLHDLIPFSLLTSHLFDSTFFLHHHILKYVLFYSEDDYTHGYDAVLATFKTEVENNCLSTSFLISSCGALSLRRLCRRMFASSILALKKFSLLVEHRLFYSVYKKS